MTWGIDAREMTFTHTIRSLCRKNVIIQNIHVESGVQFTRKNMHKYVYLAFAKPLHAHLNERVCSGSRGTIKPDHKLLNNLFHMMHNPVAKLQTQSKTGGIPECSDVWFRSSSETGMQQHIREYLVQFFAQSITLNRKTLFLLKLTVDDLV